jgi:hypothetical protein
MKVLHSTRQMKVPGVKERAVTRPTGRREYVHVGLTAAPCRRHLSIAQPLPLRIVYFHGNDSLHSQIQMNQGALTHYKAGQSSRAEWLRRVPEGKQNHR